MRRPRLSDAEKADLWARWKRGASLSAIGRALSRPPATVLYALARHGGVAPAPRRRSRWALTVTEREEISRALATDTSVRAIARRLARAPSTISREVRRHGGRAAYRAATADAGAWRAARRPKRCRLATQPRLRRVVAHKLAAAWSPQQIAGWLKITYPDTAAMHVSHETIYLSLFVQSRGVLKKALLQQLRRRATVRRARHATPEGDGRGQIVGAISIRERPAEIEDRAVPGHWEGDLIAGARQSYIATLVERQSRYVVLVRVPAKDTASVVAALTRAIQRLPRGLMSTLTWDRGHELASHRAFTVATNVQVYFCDPHSPWQRGSNENTNGLLRQYFPKGANAIDFATVSQAELNVVARRLNTRPRKTLGYRTPAAMLASIVATTG